MRVETLHQNQIQFKSNPQTSIPPSFLLGYDDKLQKAGYITKLRRIWSPLSLYLILSLKFDVGWMSDTLMSLQEVLKNYEHRKRLREKEGQRLRGELERVIE